VISSSGFHKAAARPHPCAFFGPETHKGFSSAARRASEDDAAARKTRRIQGEKRMATDDGDYRYFLTYSGVSLPLNLVSPLAANDLNNRNTYFRARYDDADRLLLAEKLVYGEVELSHAYEYRAEGGLARAVIVLGEDETEVLFDESGKQMRA
jgi:hypothetical protein